MKKNMIFLLVTMTIFVCRSQNLLNNPDFQRLYGTYPMDWGRNIAGVPNAVKLLPNQGPNRKNAVRLDLSEMVSYPQGGLRLVPGEQYEIGAWVRTRDFRSQQSGIIIYNDGWFDESGVSPIPANTDGKWMKVTKTVSCPHPSTRRRSYFNNSPYYAFTVYAVEARGQLDVASPFLIPVSDKAKEFSRHGKSLLDNVRIVPVSPRLSELPSRNAVISFYWPSSPKGKVWCKIYSEDGNFAQGKGEITGHRAKIRFPRLPVGTGILLAEVDQENGKGFLPAGDYAVKVLEPLEPSPIRRLNNLAAEVSCRKIEPGRYAFSFAEGGWVYVKTKAPKICVDGRQLSGFMVEGSHEFMCHIPAGRHEITLDPSAGTPQALRRIPEIHVFAFDFPQYNEKFWKKHLLPHVNAPSASSGWSPRKTRKEYLAELFRSGRELAMNNGIHTRKKYDPLQIANDFRHNRGMIFGSCLQYDELDPALPESLIMAFSEALWQLQDIQKPVYIWAEKGGKFLSPQVHTSLISAVSNVAGGRGKIQNETYCRLWADEKLMESALSKYRDSVAFAKSYYPDYPRHMLMIAGGYLSAGNHVIQLTSNPECDPKAGIDRFFHMCANDPVFEGLYGIGIYAIHHSDEEMVRWYGKLFRHYGIEGKKELLSEKYGFRLKTEYLKNCDFTDGLENWSVQGKVTAGRFDNLGKMQGRNWARRANDPQKDLGNSAAVLSPGSSISQTAEGMIPGRRYSVTCIVAERSMVESKKKNSKIKPEIKITLSQADQINCRKKHSGGFLTVKVIFTARKAQTGVTFSSLPGKPGELVLNYVAFRPYFSEGAEK